MNEVYNVDFGYCYHAFFNDAFYACCVSVRAPRGRHA